MNFLDRFVSGEFSHGTEEKKVVMDKTISVSSNPSEETIKVDNLDSDNSIEKDIFEQRKAERDIIGTVPLPLFRFEDKQKPEIIQLIKQIAEVASEELKNNIGGPYTPLFGYVDVMNKKDIEHLVNLTISRNKELFNTSAKEFEIEAITCYVDKKLRVRFNITEDKVIDEKIDVEYSSAKRTIERAFKKLAEAVIERIKLKESGTEKDIKIYVAESAGDENYGTGYSIFVKYEKLIDYSNYKRGKEDYIFSNLFDEDFKKSLENNENTYNIEEQISINPFRSTEAIADGMSENSEDENSEEENQEGEETDATEDEFEAESGDEEGEDDMGGDDFGGDGEDGMDDGDDSNDDSSSSDSSGSSSKPKIAGQNPFAEINSKEKVSIEFNELKSQIDKVLLRLDQFKSNVVVKKLIELDSFVGDALKNSYTVPIHDSLIRYSLYMTQFEDLISELEKYFELSKSAQNTK